MQPRGAGEDSTLATPPPRRSLVVPAFCPWTLPPRPPLPSLWGALVGIQGPTAQPPTSWQGHTLGVSSGGRSGLGGHSPGNQAGEGTRDASHPGGGAVVSRVPTSTSWPSGQGSPLLPTGPTLLPAQRPLLRRKEPWTARRKVRAAPLPPGLRVPQGRQGKEAGPRLLMAAPPARPALLPGVIFLPSGRGPDTPELVLRNRLFFPRW